MMWSSRVAVVRQFAGAVCILLCSAGCVDKSNMYSETPPGDGGGGSGGSGGGAKTVSVQYLKTIYTGYPTPITEEWDIRGTVIATDRYGTFPNTLIVQDATGGIEIKAGGKELFIAFPIGQQIAVRCQGLVLGAYGQSVSLGTASANPDYQNGFIPDEEVPSRLRKIGGFAPVLPDTLPLTALSPGKVSCFVAFEGLQFISEEAELTWSDPDKDTDRHLVDRSGDTLVVRTSHKALFAGELLPAGSGYIEGILGYFNKNYQLRILQSKSVVMESPRFVPQKRDGK